MTRLDKLRHRSSEAMQAALASVDAETDDTRNDVARSGPALHRASVMTDLVNERDSAKARAAEIETAFAGASPVRVINARRTRPSQYANRDQHSLARGDTAFDDLVRSIAQGGRNDIPIVVRAIAHAEYEFEVVAGHRRHAAVLSILDAIERGESDAAPPKLFAEIRALDDADMLAVMWQENADRKDLSAWEAALTIAAWQSVAKMTLRNLEDATGIARTTLARYLQVSQLPLPVLDAFGPDRRKIPVRALVNALAGPLRDDEAGVLERAQAVIAENATRTAPLPASSVITRLVAPEAGAAPAAPAHSMKRKGDSFMIAMTAISDAQVEDLERVINRWLAKQEPKP